MIRVGTSGWSYKEWVGGLYPKGTGAGEFLKIYAENFGTVEINNTFYRMPQEKMMRGWREKSPSGFIFAVKMWRAIVHAKEPDQQRIKAFFKAIDALEDRLGPILFQFPPNRKPDIEWLEAQLKAMPKGYRYVYELRDRRWLCDPVYDVLRKYNAANCYYDFKGFANPEVPTADFLYVRLHGPHVKPYFGAYPPARLRHYATLLRNFKGDGYCYFDNTGKGEAVLDAKLLDSAVSKHRLPSARTTGPLRARGAIAKRAGAEAKPPIRGAA